MHFTQYAVGCILALPSLTLSAPLPSIPNDASPLDGRDPKFVTNLDHFLSTYSHVPFSAEKPRRDVHAGLDIERRDPPKLGEELEARKVQTLKPNSWSNYIKCKAINCDSFLPRIS
ncbi:hypothetical protein B0O99DRAFT_588074 [Bisporella sp. PMI_857]|nr:hypothetical protein B0O99DRAFT_588074 [Bisporella sp. PMI_857]